MEDEIKDKPGSKPNNEKPQGATALQIFGRTLGILTAATGAIGKWQRGLTEDRRQKIKTLFTVPRNDPADPFKPNSELAVNIMGEQPLKKSLAPEQLNMLQTVAAHYDYCLPLDIVEWPQPVSEVSVECREQLEKLPTWLKGLILLRYDKIVEYFGSKTHYFLRMLANRVDFQRSIPMKLFEFNENEDEEDTYTINKRFVVTQEDVDAPISHSRRERQSVQGTDLFKVAHAIVLWRLPKSARAEWDPTVVDRCAVTLKNAMLTQTSPTEVGMAAEDDKAYVISDESETEDLYKAQSWQEIVSEKPEFQSKIRFEVEKEFNHIPYEFRNLEEEDVTPKIKKRRERWKQKEEEEKVQRRAKRNKWWKPNDLDASGRDRQERKEELINRGIYRRYSQIWRKNCPKEEIAPTTKRAHHYRIDEGFHAYVVALVGSSIFKAIILLVIVFNAIVLAVETGKIAERHVVVFEVLDDWFLSVYLMEFIVKIYAHPLRYWKSGFNIFDFCILVVSFVKAIMDWLSYADVKYLKVLVIVRALRILRGVSVNIQIQVLVTALVETLKTHVLSVILLLFILIYISSIISYYMFGDKVPKDWGDIGMGMLNLFAFVTMDGWTDKLEKIEDAGVVHGGRLFCLVGIVLGNFVFSNIFIAIIIMQISEATDSFRNKQQQDREAIVKRKKDTVYKRQKLDMRQLLSRQRLSMSVDFYYLVSQFQKLLRHDDLVDIQDVPFSPMWVDCVQKSSQRCLHTSNVLMNLHRQVADTLLEIYHLYQQNKSVLKPIRRARYNRCLRLRAKLALLKNEFYRTSTKAKETDPTKTLRVKMPNEDEESFNPAGSISSTLPK